MDALSAATILRPNDFSCSTFRISRLQLMIKCSRLMKDCDNIIMNSVLHNNDDLRASVLKNVDSLRQGFADWFRRWHDVLHPPLGQSHTTYLGRGDSLYEREGAAVACRLYTVVCNRLHIALGGPEALALEAAAKRLVDDFPVARSAQNSGTAKFNAAMSEVVYQAFYNTTKEWKAYAKGKPERPIASDLWRTWLAQCGVFPAG